MRRSGLLNAGLGLLLCAGTARAQMIPIADQRENHAQATFVGVTSSLTENPSAPFAYFNSFLEAYVPNPDPKGPGSCHASAFQVSQFFPAGISASGSTSGSWNVLPDGYYGGFSLARFRFRLDHCIEYQLDAWVEPGDFVGSGAFILEAYPTHLQYYQTNTGEIHTTGRLSPGEYVIEGRSSFTTSVEEFQGGTYSYIFTCSSCPNPFILGQPVGLLIACDTDAMFSVTTQVPPAGLTFQWRRNGVPLANGGNVSGATSATLAIADACYPDTGSYDVLVSDGTILEPSQPARLDITGGTTGVEPGAMTPRSFAIALAGPNPFTRETAFRYVSPESRSAAVAIYDLSGARVCTLAERVTAGTGLWSWDGRTSAGARVPAGVYFLRVEAGDLKASCRVVRLD